MDKQLKMRLLDRIEITGRIWATQDLPWRTPIDLSRTSRATPDGPKCVHIASSRSLTNNTHSMLRSHIMNWTADSLRLKVRLEDFHRCKKKIIINHCIQIHLIRNQSLVILAGSYPSKDQTLDKHRNSFETPKFKNWFS